MKEKVGLITLQYRREAKFKKHFKVSRSVCSVEKQNKSIQPGGRFVFSTRGALQTPREPAKLSWSYIS